MADVLDATAAPAFKKRNNKSTNLRKRPATPLPEQSASDSEYTDDEDGARVKRRKKDGVNIVASAVRSAQDLGKFTKYQADHSSTIAANDDATKTSNWYLEAANAADAAKAAARAQREANGDLDPTGAYKGTANYSSFIQRNPDAPNRQVGPVKAPTNIRTITVTDFAPDVCKDYKQTGFCGFGDSCKFLHAREDYKQGWQLDKDWESVGKPKGKPSATGKNGTGEDDMDEEEQELAKIPFACIICKQPYKMPVVTTKCGHYFCEKCAMHRYMKEKKRSCAACGTDTGGTFNVARKVKELLEKKRKREETRSAGDVETEVQGD